MKKVLLTAVATLSLATATIAQNVPNYVPTNGLVGWWPFNGNANDESGNNNNGTVNGATLTTDRFGNSGKAYSFDGVDDYISIFNSISFNLTHGFSVSVWFNSIVAQQSVILEKFNSINGPGDGGPQLVLRSNNLVDFSVFHNNSGNFVYSNTPCLQQSWQNIVASWNGSIIKFYQNGILEDSIPLGLILNQCTEPLTIGKRAFQSDLLFSGRIDDIGIWNRALTDQEITDLYNAVNCNLTISPQTNTLQIGNTATFNATTSDQNPNYIWQSDLGQGFQTLNNYGNYSGVNTSTLNITNVQLANHNQPIRAISTSGNCVDTSNVAYINIADTCITNVYDTVTTYISVTDTLFINVNTVGLNNNTIINTIKVFPNPANSHLNLDFGNFNSLNGYSIKIYNSLSQVIYNQQITQQSETIDLSTFGGNGVYFLHVINSQNNTVEIRKIVLQ